MSAPAAAPIAYSVRDAAAAIGVSERTIDRAVKATDKDAPIPPLRSRMLGRKRLIDSTDLLEWFRGLPEG
jgi:transposase